MSRSKQQNWAANPVPTLGAAVCKSGYHHNPRCSKLSFALLMADGRKELPVPAAIALPLQWANI